MSRITRRMRIIPITIIVVSFIFMLGIMSSASADTVEITPLTQVQWSGTNDPSGNPNASDIATIVGYIGTLEKLYKQNVGGSEEGPYASSYETNFFNTPTDPENATITYISGPYISGSPLYLLVKDGEGRVINPWWYVFDLLDLRNVNVGGSVVANYSWNGTDTIELIGFWTGTGPAGAGAISHVSIYGSDHQVPEPGILILLGIGMTAAGVASRWIRKI